MRVLSHFGKRDNERTDKTNKKTISGSATCAHKRFINNIKKRLKVFQRRNQFSKQATKQAAKEKTENTPARQEQ